MTFARQRDALSLWLNWTRSARAIELRKPQPGLVVHTDRGSQYASKLYREKLLQAKALPSMSRRGNCYDNAMAESFFSTLEFELRQHHDFHSHRQANVALADFIENYYNRKRMHSSVDYKSPVQYEENEDGGLSENGRRQ